MATITSSSACFAAASVKADCCVCTRPTLVCDSDRCRRAARARSLATRYSRVPGEPRLGGSRAGRRPALGRCYPTARRIMLNARYRRPPDSRRISRCDRWLPRSVHLPRSPAPQPRATAPATAPLKFAQVQKIAAVVEVIAPAAQPRSSADYTNSPPPPYPSSKPSSSTPPATPASRTPARGSRSST